MVMVRFLASLLLASVLLEAAQLSIAAPSEAEEFWATVLPDYPLPDALRWYLHPDANSKSPVEGPGAGDDARSSATDTADIAERLSRQWPYYYWTYGKQGSSSHEPAPAADDINTVERLSRQWPYYYWTYGKQGSPSSPHQSATRSSGDDEGHSRVLAGDTNSLITVEGPGAGDDASSDTADIAQRLSRQWPYYYWTYGKQGSPPSPHQSGTKSSGDHEGHSHVLAGGHGDHDGHSHVLAGGHGAKMNMSAVFFHEEAVQVGRSLPFYFPPARRAPLGMLPRNVADFIPFSSQVLLDILAWLGVPVGSAEAADMEKTLSMCEALSPAGEPKFCATSLEAQIEGARTVLGGHAIRPLTSILPRYGAPWQPYVIRNVRRQVGSRFVSCHDVVYLYTVYRCHDTGKARLYMVEMEGGRGGGIVDVAVVCHTDTSQWNPEHLAFKLLGTKPGGPPVCHVMPYGHMVWANSVGDLSS